MNDGADAGASFASEHLDVLVGAGRDEPEELLLIERPHAAARVRIRRWSSRDWGAPAESLERDAADVLAELERAQRRGRSFSVEMTRIRRWLGDAASSRSR